jgi:hypothetical protein
MAASATCFLSSSWFIAISNNPIAESYGLCGVRVDRCSGVPLAEQGFKGFRMGDPKTPRLEAMEVQVGFGR